MTLDQLIHKYELDAQHIADDMPQHDRWGAGQYYRHKLAMIEEFVRALKSIDPAEDKSYWIDEGCPPNDDRYVILHFSNLSLPLIGRYVGNDEDGGSYYIGDDDTPAHKDHLFVDGWAEVPTWAE